MPFIIAGLVLVIICLIILLQRKQHIDESELIQYQNDINVLDQEKLNLTRDIELCNRKIWELNDEYQRRINEQNKAIDAYKEQCISQVEEEMKTQKFAAKQLLEMNLEKERSRFEEQLKQTRDQYETVINSVKSNTKILDDRFAALVQPLQLYEKEQQQKLYYTIQIPEEYHGDINYLLTAVAEKVRHPDIISKLVWTEYIKPAMDETTKRLNIEEKSGIYKITNIDTGKCYIGKSTNVKKRLQDHYKAAVGIQSIADQAIHHAMLDEGLWNWTIEVIHYCDKEQLNDEEKYYIDFFKSQEWGYNKNAGG